MRIEDIIWLEVIVDKLAIKHHVEPDEVEEVLLNDPKFYFVENGERRGEDVYMALGQTNAGRYLTVLFIYKHPRQALILSARDMATRSGTGMENNEGNSLPAFDSIEALTTFFETHDMGHHLDRMSEVHFDVDIRRRRYLVPIEAEVMEKLSEIARAEHTSAEALINAWLHERASRAA